MTTSTAFKLFCFGFFFQDKITVLLLGLNAGRQCSCPFWRPHCPPAELLPGQELRLCRAEPGEVAVTLGTG